AVSAYCERLAALAESLRPLVEGTPWVSAGGSAYFDLVADAFAPLTGMRRILRSGAYIVHDSGFYRGISPLDTTRDLAEEEAPLEGEATGLNEEHECNRHPDAQLAVGDVVRLGLSHPCTAFEKWRLIKVLEPATATVPEAVETLF